MRARLLSVLDHDFHVAGITPSVAFLSSIPSSIDDTFFSGNVCVITKDKAFQPSSPIASRQGIGECQ